MMRKAVMIFCAGLMAASPAMAAPPHPDLAREIREGRRAEPPYLTRLRTEGPTMTGRERSALDAMRAQGLIPPAAGRAFPSAESREPAAPDAFQAAAPPTAGTPKVLTLLFPFSDTAGQVAPPFFDDLVYGSASPSVHHYFQEVSGGAFGFSTSDPPSATGWLARTGPEPWWTYAGYNAESNLRTMVEHAVAEADPLVDFSAYDNDGDSYVDYLIIVHPGPGGELVGDPSIWSRMEVYNPAIPTLDGVSVDRMIILPEYWVDPLFEDMTIGIYAHEFGHLLGLPDLYDLDLNSAGIGDWGLMGLGAWNGTINRAESPAWPSAWSRAALGWVDPVVPAANLPGTTLSPVESGGPVYYLWNHGLGNNEYFLAENRQQAGYDAFLPGHGLLIWHVDEDMATNNNQTTTHVDCDFQISHYKVALHQADALLELELNIDDGDQYDAYPTGSLTNEFSLASLPSSGSYADCDSRVGIFNIAEGSGNVTADIYTYPVAADWDGDLQADIFWRRYDTGGDALWYLDGVTYDGGASPPGTAKEWVAESTADFNGDGRPDILWRRYDSGANYLWYMDGPAYLGGDSLPGQSDPEWVIEGAPDSNGDGKPDILWRHYGTGANYVWYMDGPSYIGGDALPDQTTLAWEIDGTPDFNGDGKPDILWRRYDTGENYVWYMDGPLYAGGATVDPAGTVWEIEGTADFNGDGRADILWRRYDTGGNYVWYMNGNLAAGGSAVAGAAPLWEIEE